MEIVAILKVLWRWRLLVAVGAALAIAVAAFAGTGTAPATGLARTSIVLDTARSQLLTASPRGADTLPARGQLLADLLTSEEAKLRIAREAAIPVGQLRVVEPRLGRPPVETALPMRAVEAAAVVTEPFLVIVEYNENLPALTLEARAPDRAGAARLAEAASRVLEADDVPVGSARIQDFVVTRPGAITSRDVTPRGRLMTAAGAAIAFFALWCGCVALLPGLARLRRVMLPAH